MEKEKSVFSEIETIATLKLFARTISGKFAYSLGYGVLREEWDVTKIGFQMITYDARVVALQKMLLERPALENMCVNILIRHNVPQILLLFFMRIIL